VERQPSRLRRAPHVSSQHLCRRWWRRTLYRLRRCYGMQSGCQQRSRLRAGRGRVGAAASRPFDAGAQGPGRARCWGRGQRWALRVCVTKRLYPLGAACKARWQRLALVRDIQFPAAVPRPGPWQAWENEFSHMNGRGNEHMCNMKTTLIFQHSRQLTRHPFNFPAESASYTAIAPASKLTWVARYGCKEVRWNRMRHLQLASTCEHGLGNDMHL
jgi:hypothetical protein